MDSGQPDVVLHQHSVEKALPRKVAKPAWLRFLLHFNNVLIYVLLVAAVLTATMGHWTDTLMILGVAVINAMMSDIATQRTPLMQQTDTLGKVIFTLILVMMVALLIFSLAFRDMPDSELMLLLISLALAVVPEGLPVIMSIILSPGVQKMAFHKAIIRKLPAVETLGAMTVICADKTGTLTMNEMTVQTIITADKTLHVEGNSYEPVGKIVEEGHSDPVAVTSGSLLESYFTAIDLCNDSQLYQDESGIWKIAGNPTEGALKTLARKAGLPARDAEFVSRLPSDSQHKYLSALYRIGGEEMIFLTGAPDVLFRLCQYQHTRQGLEPLNLPWWEAQMEAYAQKGLHRVAAAWKPARKGQKTLCHEDVQTGTILLGIAGMMDPPRPEAVAAIHDCQQAGIRVKMITGDHPQTALSTGKLLGICHTQSAITGRELRLMDEARFMEAVQRYDIFAQTNPEDKRRLVQALQQQDEVVGVTGDGEEDAPALKQADVGIAMGIKANEVTKEAADMVLTDDNFATLTSAVREGRRVYDNLKKTILFIMPMNFAQGMLIIIAFLAGHVMPLTPGLILWMNMVTLATLSLGLAFEAGEKNIMNRPPRSRGRRIMDGFALWRVVFVGSMMACSAFALEAWLQPDGYSPAFSRTVLLQLLVTAQWFYMMNCRVTDGFSLNRGALRNKGIWVASAMLLVLQMLIIYAPFMQTLFGTVSLPPRYWGLTCCIGFVMFLVVEIEKSLTRRWHTGKRLAHLSTSP